MIIHMHDLARVREEHRDKKIVLTSGTFDLFHVGHVHYLQTVTSYGDIMVVLLSSDRRVRARKGPSRPIIPENDRAEILDALKVVDYVLIDPAQQPPGVPDPVYAEIVRQLQPDIYVTDGEDIRFSHLLDKSKLAILPRSESGKHSSTTAIIEHIKD